MIRRYVRRSSKKTNLFPSDYFEPVHVNEPSGSAGQQVTVHLDEVTKGILHAEALAAQKSVSALLREWIDPYFNSFRV